MGYELVDIYESAEKLLGKKAVTVRFTIGSYTDTLTPPLPCLRLHPNDMKAWI